MPKNKYLSSVNSLVDESMYNLVESDSYDKLREMNTSHLNNFHRFFIATYRVRVNENKNLDKELNAFYKFLLSIIDNDCHISFYGLFQDFLCKEFNKTPWQTLKSFLWKRNYPVQEIEKLELTWQEIDFIKEFKSNNCILSILTFFIFSPIVVQRFFLTYLFPKITSANKKRKN